MAVEIAREETERLFQVSRGLNSARDEDDLLRVMVQPAVEAGAVSANLIYLELDETDTPIWAEIAAAWSRQDVENVMPPAPVGMRYYLPEFPLVNLWLSNPDKPLLVADAETNEKLSPRIKAAMAESGNRAMVIIPLTQTGRWVGLVIFNWNKPHEFGVHETEVYHALAGLGTPAVAGRRLFAQTQTRARRQQSLREITATVSASEDMSDLVIKLPDIIEPLRQLVPVDLLSAVTYTPGDSEFTCFAVISGTESDDVARPDARVPLEGSGVGWAITHHEPWLEANLRQKKLFREDEQLVAQGILSRLVLPLQLGGQIVGALDLGSKQPDAFSRDHIPILSQVAGQIAQALERTRLMESTRAALAEAAATHRSYLRREWQDYLQQERDLRRTAIVYDREQTSAVPDFWRPEMEHVLAQGEFAAVETRETENPNTEHEARTGLAIPIVVRGQTLGVLGVEDPSGERQWSAEEISLVQAIGQQLGQALDNARLIEATRRRAAQEQLAGRVTSRMRESLDLETVLQTAIREIGEVLSLHDATIQLNVDLERGNGGASPDSHGGQTYDPA
jgi:GAF domain-containing protein